MTRLLRQLTRCELSAMVALSGLAGSLFATGHWQLQSLLCGSAIWLLAAGSSALNQWQEQDLDARMLRTRERPLPTGQLGGGAALAISASCLGGGLLLLFCLPNGAAALLLGLLAIIWYNGVYTPLKRLTPFAALPGAVCGALPPVICWVGAGRSLFAPELLILAGTLFLWQIPHTWLLLCQYRWDLQRGGLPDLFERIPTSRLLRINNSWLIALGLCYLLFPLFGLINGRVLLVGFLGGLLVLTAAISLEAVKEPSRLAPKRLFHLTNLSMALLLACLILDNLTA
jgi:protoheme IX farnesyltransferase